MTEEFLQHQTELLLESLGRIEKLLEDIKKQTTIIFYPTNPPRPTPYTPWLFPTNPEQIDPGFFQPTIGDAPNAPKITC